MILQGMIATIPRFPIILQVIYSKKAALFEYILGHVADRFRVSTLLKVLTFGALLHLQNNGNV